MKFINCALTYAKGVFRPFNIPDKKYGFVKTSLKNARIYSDVAFFLNEELKNIVFNKFNNWIWVINYWFVTA
jgi:hypothetical protein